jgi:nucleoside 2-deoxyribosyltransferase
MKCIFCPLNVPEAQLIDDSKSYNCPRCGEVWITRTAAVCAETTPERDKLIISIVLRNEYESRGRILRQQPLASEDLERMVGNYRHLDAIDKMDQALLNLDKMSLKIVGNRIGIHPLFDVSLFHCLDSDELEAVLSYLVGEGYIHESPGGTAEETDYTLSRKGYERLRQVKLPDNSQNCFVAMWFNPEMQKVYEHAVKPAIEFIEEGQTESRFKAVKIDNVEHINNINDEIIATIRRSRFMVCDLTGYRGGVYFEAGFSYGLGIPVIYTCREDWTREEILKDKDGKEVKQLYDNKGQPLKVRKEGVHFDLAHMNRIEWEEDKLDEFREKLENRIKAVIV